MEHIQESYKNRLKELAGIISEAKSQEIYFDTLAQLLEEVENYAKKNGYEIEDVYKEFFHFGIGGINYRDTKRASFNLLKDGNLIRKKLHIQVYRMDSGRYELNQYIA